MIDVKATLNDAEERMQMASMYLDESLSRIRAGRANVAILDSVRVSSYGSMVPLNQVANVSVPDARTIAIRPWDKKAIKDIEKGIMDSEIKEKLKKAIKEGLSEDNEKDAEDSLQKIHDKYIKNIDALLAEKTKEIMTV